MKKINNKKTSSSKKTGITQNNRNFQEPEGELKELETTLKETEAKYRNIFENAMEGIFQTDREGRITQANPSFARIHGYDSPDEIMHSIVTKELFADPSDHSRLLALLRSSVSVRNFEAQLRTKNGKTHWVSMNVMVFRDKNGRALSYEGTMLDITERKKTEEALLESEERYRVAIENSNDGVLILQGDLCHYANKEFMRMFEFDSPEEIVGKSIKPIFHSDDIEMVTDIINRRQRGEPVPSRYEFKGITKKGNTLFVEVSAAGITYRGISVYLIYMRDITKRKEVEKSLVKSRSIFQNAQEGIFETDRRGYFTEANPSLARMHGYKSPDEITDSISARELFVDPSDHDRLIDLLHKSGSVQNFEAQLRMKNGITHWVSMNAMAFRDKNGKILSYEGTMLDITERKKTEEALVESEERYRVAIENSNDGITMLHGDICQYANKQFVRMFEFDSLDEIIGKSIKSTIHPDDIEMVTDIMNRRQNNEPVPPRYEFKGLTKKGNILFVEVSAANITYRGISVYLIYLRDITERKLAEQALMKSHKELERLNKAKTKAVNHVSHELKTPLAVIQGNIRILKRKLEDVPSFASGNIIDALERNTERLLELSRETDEIFRVSQEVEAGMALNDLDRLLERMGDLSEIPEAIRSHWQALKEWTSTYLAGSTESFQSIDLYQFILSLVEKTKKAVVHRNLHFKVNGFLGSFIFMDPFILRGVAEGLIKNAIENTPDGGLIEISTDRDDRGIILRVADRGIGITEENQASLLDGLFHTKDTELYTTKKPFEFGAGGKGLDLLRIKYYARRYGFDISLKSTRCVYIPTDSDICPGSIAQCAHCKTVDDCHKSGGTTFTVTFPQRSNPLQSNEKQ